MVAPFYGNVDVVGAYEKAKQTNIDRGMQEFGVLQKILAQRALEQRAQQQIGIQQEGLGIQREGLGLRREALTQQSADRAAALEATAAQRDATLGLQRDTLNQRAADTAAAREQRMQELKMRLSDQRLAAADRAALQRELMMMRAEQQRTDAEVKRQNSPQAIKEREKVEGRTSLSSLLTDLEADYTEFQRLGADIDPGRNSVGNIVNRVASSGVGQLVGGAVGTKEQAIRDSINAKRASLMAAIKQATGMGATQMNSNVELQFYLRMATDPTLARSANQKAIKWLRDTYGVRAGAATPAATSAPEAPAAGGGWSIRPLP